MLCMIIPNIFGSKVTTKVKWIGHFMCFQSMGVFKTLKYPWNASLFFNCLLVRMACGKPSFIPFLILMYESIFNFWLKLILLNKLIWELLHFYFNTFESIKRCTQVEIFYINAYVFCIGCWKDAVPHNLGGGYVGSSGGVFVRVVDVITTHHDLDLVWVVFWWSVAADYSGICDSSIICNCSNLTVGEEFDYVGAFGVL